MITIESIKPEDFQLIAKWLSDPAINRWLASDYRGKQVEPRIVAMVMRNRKNRLFLVSDNAKPSGLVALADLDMEDRCAMIWYLLGESGKAGRGITSQAVYQLCLLAFQEIGLSSLYAWIMEPNRASRRVLEKNYFREIGTMRRATKMEKKTIDRIYFDRIAEVT